MNASIKLLDKYAQTCKHRSDSDTARALKVRPSAVNNWRHERAHPNAEAIEKMCATIGEPLRTWLPLIEAERARTPEDRRVWLRLAQAAASLALIYVCARSTIGHDFAASVASSARNPVTLYIMFNLALGIILAVWLLHTRSRHVQEMEF